jgi:hypothetical protein
MTRDEAIHLLGANESDFRARGVVGVSLFGSVARGEATGYSDIDLVVDVEPDRRFSLIDLADVRLLAYDVTGMDAGVVVRADLEPTFRSRIAPEEVRVF